MLFRSEFVSGLELFRVNKLKAPFGTRGRPDGRISLTGQSRSFAISPAATRAALGTVVRQQSSVTGAVCAALCLVARELFCPAPKAHRFILVGSFDARPLLNLPTEALGYYATYPKFPLEVSPTTDFWELARRFHAGNQAYIETRAYAGMEPGYYNEIASGFGALTKLLWVPGLWELSTAPGRLFMANFGVLESGIGRFKLRDVKILQDIPALSIYSYVLDGSLRLQVCSPLPPEAADHFAGQIEKRLRVVLEH